MTEKALEKEAIKYAVDYPTSYGKGYRHKDLRIAYLAGAEPREKQIQIDAEQIRALQKQNRELTDKVKELEEELIEADNATDVFNAQEKRIEELEAQIDKMKCCGNCKYYKFQNDAGYYTCTRDGKRNGKNYRSCEFNLEKWEGR